MDELPPPTDVDLSFASYHSKSEVVGDTLRYTRSFEVKELTVPVEEGGRAEEVLSHHLQPRAQHGGAESRVS